MKNRSFFSIWPAYVIGTLLIGVIFSWAIDLKTKPSKEQSIDFCIVADKVNVSELKSCVKENLKEYDMLEVNTHVLSSRSSKFNYLYSSIDDSADVFILPSSLLIDNEFEKYNSSFNVLNSITDSSKAYSYNGYTYGYKIYDKENKCGYGASLINYSDDDYYMFLSVNSAHQEITATNVASFYNVIESLGYYEEK